MTQGAEDWIVRKVGDVARPRRLIRASKDIAHIPGEWGVWTGIRTILGMFHEGNAYFLRKRAEHGDVVRLQFGPDPIVCVFDPELVSKILKNDDGVWSAALGWRTLLDRIDTTSDTMDMLASISAWFISSGLRPRCAATSRLVGIRPCCWTRASYA